MSSRESRASDMAMKGGGYYSLVTKGAKDVIDAVTPLVLSAIAATSSKPADRPFTIADMGCADGGTSIDMVHAAIATLRKAAPQRPVLLVYSDQPRNDYNALFATLDRRAAKGPALSEIEGVHVVASATSFYHQILPSGTLDLGFSATAMHWLSHKPCDITDHVQAVGAKGGELAAFAAQGQQDWETILGQRAAELAPGGRLVLANFCRDEAGRYLGHTGGIDMFDSFNNLWRRFLSEGRIEESEYSAMTLPQYYKSVAEFCGPLEDPANPIHRAGLRLEGIETRVTPCPYADAFKHGGDAETFARTYVPTLRSWTESTFFAGLSAARPQAERQDLIDLYYDSYEAEVRRAPEGHAMDYVHALMTISKLDGRAATGA